MNTKLVPASRLTTRHFLVEPGPRKREALKICEVTEYDNSVSLRVRVGSAIESRRFYSGDQVRVVKAVP